MAIDAFLIKYDYETPQDFAGAFLSSGDFNLTMLQNICADLWLPTHEGGRTKAEKISTLAQKIAASCVVNPDNRNSVIKELVFSKKTWVAVYKISALFPKQANDPKFMVVKEGKMEWYGPLQYPSDVGGTWYIKPDIIPHTYQDVNGEFATGKVRWMCFARIEGNILTLLWNGFTDTVVINKQRKEFQFHYWEKIPKIVDDFSDFFRCRVTPVDLSDLVLYKLWEKYRYDDSYHWADIKIRAEAGGVFLNAKTSRAKAKTELEEIKEQEEIDLLGIQRLAKTIRQSIQTELEGRFKKELPHPEHFDEAILGTLIREFGTLSYDFQLTTASKQHIFRGHVYFGMKQNGTPDTLAHIGLVYHGTETLDALNFIIGHCRTG